MSEPYYITTPIYYVNDKPHIGHCYTTLLADVAARFMRARGRDVFFLTGTDEHAEKVVDAAAQRGLTPIEWADQNAGEFERAFAAQRFTNDDFVRTTQDRHKDKVTGYITRLMEQGDVELGEYAGWWDASQEEYVTESTAREHDYKSPVTGKELEKRTEQNYFFDLPKYAERLREHIEASPGFILPEARKNEVLGRIKAGLQRVPVSRAVKEGDADWGILMPGDEGHRIYVWIDALFNYLSTVDTNERRRYWHAPVHVMAKDILWFHAVIWPCMLMALGEAMPSCIYAHSYWIREGRKMSKSLGNFIDLPTIDAYVDAFGLDAWRWYLVNHGPLAATDSDFGYGRFVEVYNADLANGIGNASSRVSNMIAKYFDGACPKAEATTHAGRDWPALAGAALESATEALDRLDFEALCRAGLSLSNEVDGYIHETEPFKLAKDETKLGDVGTILYNCAEALRIAAVLLSCTLPEKMSELLGRMGQEAPGEDGSFGAQLEELCTWGRLEPGTRITKGDALYPRWDAKNPEPAPETQEAGA